MPTVPALAVVYEVRTAGNDANGGGNVPKATVFDLVVDASLNTKVTSASYTFVSGDVGSTVTVFGGTGWTAGVYTISSVASGAATLNSSPAAVSTKGGFAYVASGVDYSQFDNKNSSGGTSCGSTTVNLSTTDAVANGTTTVTSATANFTAALVGNVINIGGNWYEVSAVGSSTSITVDRTITTATGLTLNIGGALATIGQAVTLMNAQATSGHVTWIKSGTYTLTSTITIASNTSTTGNPFSLIGYGTNRGDNGTRPLVTTATNSTNLFTLSTAGTVRFQRLSMSNTAATRGYGVRASAAVNGIALIDCIMDGFLEAIEADINVDWGIYNLYLINCEIKNCTSTTAAVANSGTSYIFGCYIHDNSGAGLSLADDSSFQKPGPSSIQHTIFYNNKYGIDNEAAQAQWYSLYISNCVFASQTSDGIKTKGDSPLAVLNSIFYGNAGFGINATVNGGQAAPAITLLFNNAYGSNTSGDLSSNLTGAVSSLGTKVLLSGDPFNGRTSGDFSLNSTAGAGAACQNAGFPGALAAGGTGYEDIGALRHQDPAGSSGALLTHPGMSGGMRG